MPKAVNIFVEFFFIFFFVSATKNVFKLMMLAVLATIVARRHNQNGAPVRARLVPLTIVPSVQNHAKRITNIGGRLLRPRSDLLSTMAHITALSTLEKFSAHVEETP